MFCGEKKPLPEGVQTAAHAGRQRLDIIKGAPATAEGASEPGQGCPGRADRVVGVEGSVQQPCCLSLDPRLLENDS